MGQDVTPLPAVAAGMGPFNLKAVPLGMGGCCALPGEAPGVFEVPLETGSLQAFAIRAHELGHLGLLRSGALPKNLVAAMGQAKIHFAWTQLSLDVVVNAFMAARGVPEISQLRLWSDPLPAEIPRWLAAMEFLRSEGLASECTMRMSLHGRARFSREDLQVLCSAAAFLQQCGRQAARCAALVADQPILSIRQFRTLLKTLQKRFGPTSAAERHPLLERTFFERRPVKRRRKGPADLSIPKGNQWGHLEILTPPLVRVTGPAAKAARKLSAHFAGPFRFPHRALPAADGRAFGVRKRKHCGTILIDCSGSMHLSEEELHSLVSRSAAPTVAVYAGLPGNENGLLAIVAKGGRCAQMEDVASRFGTGNVVDGPALTWLAQQPEPRIWISDGGVTGLADDTAENLQRDAERIQRAGRIKRFGSIAECNGLQRMADGISS